jgi:hypothetical protein
LIGAEAEQSTLCVVKNLFTTLVCKGCGKRRPVYVLSLNALLKSSSDLSLVRQFLNFITQTYKCGYDFSEVASNIKLSKKTFIPYTPTFMGNLALCCKHQIEERLYKLDELKRTCYVCGEDSTRPIVTNQFPLCAKVCSCSINYDNLMCHTLQYYYHFFKMIQCILIYR